MPAHYLSAAAWSRQFYDALIETSFSTASINLAGDIVRVSRQTHGPEFLQALIDAEQVTRFTGGIHDADMKGRLGESDPTRCIFAMMRPDGLAHASVQVVFTSNGLAKDHDAIIAGRNRITGLPDTATCTSISAWPGGKKGMGAELIHRLRKAAGELPIKLTILGTASPMTGFRKWLAADDPDLRRPLQYVLDMNGKGIWIKDIVVLCQNENLAPHRLRALSGAERNGLMRLGVFYTLYGVQAAKGFRAANGVAHFHLSNGASLQGINWESDTTAMGIDRSLGIMVNYHYPLNEEGIAHNRQAYLSGAPAHSSDIKNMLEPVQRSRFLAKPFGWLTSKRGLG